MRNLSIILFFVIQLFVFQSCSSTNLGKKDPNSLYISTVIATNTVLEISTEDKKVFWADAQNKSDEPVQLLTETENTTMLKNRNYSYKVLDNGTIRFKNLSSKEAKLVIRIYNHSSKVLQKTSVL